MQRDPRAFLWDVREAAFAIRTFTYGMEVSAYENNQLVQAAVERKLEVIGEALNQFSKWDAAMAARLAANRGVPQPTDSRRRHGQTQHSVDHCSKFFARLDHCCSRLTG